MPSSGVVYYNENDPHAADWLEELINRELIAFGVVDRRPIQEVEPDDLIGYDQHHFFAGIGCWSYALRLAGVPDDFPVWTGSCPCQPFSAAGAKKGQDDDRHLWPWWYELIVQCKPAIVFGEQVGSPLGRAWLDDVLADLEDVGFAVGAGDLPAAGVGAPHIRQRLWFGGVDADRLADDDGEGLRQQCAAWVHDHRQPGDDVTGRGEAGGVAESDGGNAQAGGQQRSGEQRLQSAGGRAEQLGDTTGSRRAGREKRGEQRDGVESVVSEGGEAERLGHHHHPRRQGRSVSAATRGRQRAGELPARAASPSVGLGNTSRDRAGQHAGELRGDEAQHALRQSHGIHSPVSPSAAHSTGATSGWWANCDWVACRDGVYRPLEPGLVALVDGVAFRLADGRTPVQAVSRTQILRGLGNAIVPQVAAEFIAAFLEAAFDGTA